jgi:glycosyltransferase involved in cell wall biosynthesis
VKVLVISTYPPARDGIARYAAHVVGSLRKRGDAVRILSPEPSAADDHANLSSYRGLTFARKLARAADRTVVEFVPGLFFATEGMFRKLRLWPVLLSFLGSGNVELVVHEAPYRAVLQASGLRGTLIRAFWRSIFTTPSRTFVHTDFERQQMVRSIGVDPASLVLLPHGELFEPRTSVDRSQARADLGIPADEFAFLCIGFLQEHKGFDRAVRALGRLGPGRVRLDIVGSARTSDPVVEAYAADLRNLVASTPRSHLHNSFVSDELFDRWIIASDVVVLPYRDIWSSGVLERAKLLGRPAIVTAVGGLPDQAGPDTRIASDDAELAAEMAGAAGVGLVQDILTELTADPKLPLRERMQVEIEARADTLRATAGADRESLRAPATPPSSRDIRPIFLPNPDSGGWLRSSLKRFVYRTVRWLLGPLVAQVNDRLGRLAESQAELESRLRSISDSTPPDAPTLPAGGEERRP